ncbi:tumor necrosis factor receptor superfamily member 18 [Aulostomus maculatus]
MGEKAVRTGSSEYNYQCKPACPDHEYYNVKQNVCRPRTLCSTIGLVEQFPGNKTHDSICTSHAIQNEEGFLHVTQGISIILYSVTLLVFLTSVCIYFMRKNRAYGAQNPPVDTLDVPGNTCNFGMSKEESGVQPLIEEESCHSKSHLHVETV